MPLTQAVAVNGSLVSIPPNYARPSQLQPRQHAGRPKRVAGSTVPARYGGPLTRAVPDYQPQYHPTISGMFVQANPYWAVTGQKPSSPVVKRKPVQIPSDKTPGHSMYGSDDYRASDAVATVAAKGTPTTNYSQAGVYGLEQNGNGALTSVLNPGEARFTCNPAPGWHPTDALPPAHVKGTQLGNDFNGGSFKAPRRSLWLMGTRCLKPDLDNRIY